MEAGDTLGTVSSAERKDLPLDCGVKARVGYNKVKILEFGDRPGPWREEKEGQTQSRVMTWVMRVGRESRRTMRHQGT